MTQEKGPSIAKQIAGAVIGGSLGLLVYTAYEYGAPTVIAWLSIPQKDLPSNGEGSRIASTNTNDRDGLHFEARAREIAQEFGAAYKNYQVKEAAQVSSAASSERMSSAASSTEVVPFEGASEEIVSSAGASSEASEASSDEWTESHRAKAVREMWNNDAIEKAPGPDTDALPDSGIGLLGALMAAGAGAGGLRARKRK